MNNIEFDIIHEISPSIEDILPFIDKTFIFQRLWHFPKPKNQQEIDNLELLFVNTINLAKKENTITPKARFASFKSRQNGNGVILESTKNRARFDFPRETVEPHFCLADLFKDFITLALVTVGNETTKLATQLYKDGKYPQVLYIKGLAAACAEATLEFTHDIILKKFNTTKNMSKRYSLGYKSCPNLMDQEKFIKLLKGSEIGIISSETFQLIPEYSVSAFISFLNP